MKYVYILRSKKDGRFYVGCTSNINKRLEAHNSGKVPSTKYRIPLELIYFESFKNQTDAFLREKWLKTGWGRNHTQKMLQNTLKSLGG